MKLRIFTVPFLMALLIATASAQYTRTDLVSNQPGVAPTTDPHLVNAWGLVALPTSHILGQRQWHRILHPLHFDRVYKFHSS